MGLGWAPQPGRLRAIAHRFGCEDVRPEARSWRGRGTPRHAHGSTSCAQRWSWDCLFSACGRGRRVRFGLAFMHCWREDCLPTRLATSEQPSRFLIPIARRPCLLTARHVPGALGGSVAPLYIDRDAPRTTVRTPSHSSASKRHSTRDADLHSLPLNRMLERRATNGYIHSTYKHMSGVSPTLTTLTFASAFRSNSRPCG